MRFSISWRRSGWLRMGLRVFKSGMVYFWVIACVCTGLCLIISLGLLMDIVRCRISSSQMLGFKLSFARCNYFLVNKREELDI